MRLTTLSGIGVVICCPASQVSFILGDDIILFPGKNTKRVGLCFIALAYRLN